jgi:hypothetical protein
MWSSDFFFGISHAFGRVTVVPHDCLVWNSRFEAQIIAESLRSTVGVLPRQRYRGASGGLSSIGKFHQVCKKDVS